ncbi:MAG TPA: DUF5615 family PIN-like protein [Rhizomicrobium sp.]
MKKLFVCDEHIPPSLAVWLRAQGMEAVHIFEIGFESAPDGKIWRYAEEKDGIIVTKDKGFVQDYIAKPGPRMILVGIGNSTKRVLFAKFSAALPQIMTKFEMGRRLVELR